MPIRFPVKAANADILGDDATNESGAPAEKTLNETPNAQAKRDPYLRNRESWRNRAEGKPGQDINAAGFIRDKDLPPN